MATLVLDTSLLSCFARAGRLEQLARLTEGFRLVTTGAVMEELRRGAATYPVLQEAMTLPWLEVVALEGLEDLAILSEYANLLVSGERNLGEAEVLAWAEGHEGIPVTDDQAAVQAARLRGLSPKRTLALVARGVRLGWLSSEGAASLVDELIQGGARFPCSGREFMVWASDSRLI